MSDSIWVSVEQDCDGPRSYVYADWRFADATIGDRSEWFEVTDPSEVSVILECACDVWQSSDFARHGYASCNGNVFALLPTYRVGQSVAALCKDWMDKGFLVSGTVVSCADRMVTIDLSGDLGGRLIIHERYVMAHNL
jgi:hypothetical protein